MKKIWYIWLLGICGLFLSTLALYIGLKNKDLANSIGIISTIISILLAVISGVYTLVSGEKTLRYLDEIKKQNSDLIDRLNYELSKENFGKNNIENIKKNMS